MQVEIYYLMHFQIMFSCQPVGHTHGAVDAAFGNLVRKLKTTDALVLNGEFYNPMLVELFGISR